MKACLWKAHLVSEVNRSLCGQNAKCCCCLIRYIQLFVVFLNVLLNVCCLAKCWNKSQYLLGYQSRIKNNLNFIVNPQGESGKSCTMSLPQRSNFKLHKTYQNCIYSVVRNLNFSEKITDPKISCQNMLKNHNL